MTVIFGKCVKMIFLAGMVSVCAGCDVMKPWAGLVTGFIGGVVYVLGSKTISAMKVDDPLDAVAVHLGSGFWGLIACPLFMYDNGIVYSGSLESLETLGWNMAGAAAIFGWQAVCGVLTFGFLKVIILCQFSIRDVLFEFHLKFWNTASAVLVFQFY